MQGGAALSVLLKRESQGDFAADYCFDAIVSKISASTTVGVPSLSAHCRAGSADAKMRARHQTQVSAEVVTKTGATFQRLDRERKGSDCLGRGKSSADNRQGRTPRSRNTRASSDGRVGIHLGRTSRTVLEPDPCAPFLALVASSWRYVNVYTCLTPGGT